MGTPQIIAIATAINVAANTLTFDTSGFVFQDGDILIAALRSQSPSSTADWQSTGFNRVGPAFSPAYAVGRVTGFYRREILDASSAPASVTFSGLTGSTQRNVGNLLLIRGSGVPVEVDTFYNSYIGDVISLGRRIPAYSTSKTNMLVLVMGTNEITSPNQTAPTSEPSGYTQKVYTSTSTNTSISRTVCGVWSYELSSGNTLVANITWQFTSSAVAQSIALWAPDPPTPNGYAVELGDGSTAYATVYNGSEVNVSDILVIPKELRGFTVSEMDTMIAANDPVYWAHRGGSVNWPQMTMRAYTNAIWHGMRALEVTARQSSDGVWIMIHDATTDGVTASSYTVSNELASTLLGIPVDTPTTGGVLGRIEDLLEAYPNHVLIADRKAAGNLSQFIAKLQTVPNYVEHVLLKFDGIYDVAAAQAAHAVGIKTAGYWWNTNYSNLATAMPHCDYPGLNYDADQSVWDTFLAYGKPMWGHICSTLAAADMARAKGAKIVQCSGVKAIVPALNTIN